jgi:NADH dehydrogenase [ubiquinone] 1 alpha subcomplex assembly factor 7
LRSRAIIDRIAARGPITIAEYMALCLHDRELGYYRSGDPLGEAGDFTTAPEVSQVFGELIGLWALDSWTAQGLAPPLRLVELGPGRGTLMADALRAIGQVSSGARPRVDLVEINPALIAKQRATLATHDAHWHDTLDTVTAGAAVVIANEVIDALPIRQFQRTALGWAERCVTVDRARGTLAFTARASAEPDHPASGAARDGDILEVPEAARVLVEALASRVARAGGAALLIDYGPMASGIGDTLQAVRRHRPIGVLEAPGDSDLTAHVDFAQLAAVARAAGARGFGPVPQGAFLHRLGFAARVASLSRRASPAQARDLEAANARLLGAGEMGTLFKALAILPAGASTPSGFDPPNSTSP